MQHGLSEDLYVHVDSYAENDAFSAREKLAIEYAERFALDHQNIGDELINRMRAEFSDHEIVELAGMVAYCMGIGRVYTVLDIANECPIVR